MNIGPFLFACSMVFVALGVTLGASASDTAEHDACVALGTIGTARIDESGVLTLYLVAHGANGAIGDGVLTYKPSDKDYADVLRHIGEIHPGETLPVRPWCD